MSNGVAIPAAILIGSAMVAVALYLGLSARAPAGTPSVLQGPLATTPALVARATEAARSNLDASRPAMAAACLQGVKGPLRFRFEMAFDARGHELLRGISLVGAGPAEVATCLRDRFPPALRVPTSGARISVTATIDLP